MSDIMKKMLKSGKTLFAGIIAFSIVLSFFPYYVFAGSLPDTGQTKCYDNVGEIPCPQPGEPFYGQDGCYTINPPSYTKLDAQGNDLPDSVVSWVMVRDNVTGLIWEVKTDDGSIHYMYNRYRWQNAQDEFIAELNSQQFGGYSDWRMPTIKELTAIIDHGKHDPSINTDYFPNTLSPQYWRPGYWSSTTFANKNDDAWGVSFYSANVSVYLKSDYSDSGNFVRAVRGGSGTAQHSLVDNGDRTITDTATGLIWQKETAESKMQWEDALSYCENLTLAGYNDWRLPNERELGSLVDYSKYGPSIDTIFFPDTVSFYYWSSTTYSLDRRQACDMSFESGQSQRFDKYYKYGPYYVRAVRGGQASSFNNLTFPLSGTVADRTVNLSFGADWLFGECDGLVKKHAGVDISAVKGESVYAAKSGIVRAIVDGGTQWKKAVTIEHTSSNPVFTTVYWHIDPVVEVDQEVTSGQIIGNIADLGDNTHFHFGVRMSAYSNTSNRGALPQTDCDGDPAFPEHFVDPLGLYYNYCDNSVILNLSVYDSDTGDLVEEANITVGSIVKQTNSNGDTAFPDLSKGQYEIAISASGYEPYHTTINLNNTGATSARYGLIPAVSSPAGKPAIIDVTSYYSNRNKQALFLDGVDCTLVFSANVNCNGKIPDRVRFITPGNAFEETTGSHTFNMGQDFGPGGRLTVVAISQDGTGSNPFDANIGVMPLPPGLPVTPGIKSDGSSFSYKIEIKDSYSFFTNILPVEGLTVSSDIPIFGDKQLSLGIGADIAATIGSDGTATYSVVKPGKGENGFNMAGVAFDTGWKLGGDINFKYMEDEDAWQFDSGYLTFAMSVEKGIGPAYTVVAVG
ncbi:MAG: DUF1566 domain-containing protein, partial [Proteobacteria bacterium]|nr:DUF1566 domain-containing protein [Pseudomonadota bacterium]